MLLPSLEALAYMVCSFCSSEMGTGVWIVELGVCILVSVAVHQSN